jgi:YD repeat-containing protein
VSGEVVANDGSTSTSSDHYVYTYGSATGTNTDPAADTGSDANSLTQVTDNGAVKENYSYDGVGNFTNDSTLGTADAMNRYSALTYNGRGDVTNDSTYAYTYDANDRMISITPHDTTKQKLTYGYDSQGRRLWKDVFNWDATTGKWSTTATSSSRTYVYDGTNLVVELDQSGAMVTGYTWGANGQLLAVTDYTQSTPRTYEALIDASGNTAMLVDPTSGAVAATYKYDSYGNLKSATGPAQAACSILSKGLYCDVEARSIEHALNRDAKNNIWYEDDPSGEQSDENLGRLYSGDPINNVDLSGLGISPVQGSLSNSGIGAQLQLFTSSPATEAVDIHIGWVYTATGAFDGRDAIYTGKATSLVTRLFDNTSPTANSPKHLQAEFLRQRSTEISARPVYGNPDAITTNADLGRAQKSQEQIQMGENGWSANPSDRVGPEGEVVLNDKAALTPAKQSLYEEKFNTSLGESVVVKEAGADLNRAQLRQLDNAVDAGIKTLGASEPLEAAETMSKGEATVGVNGAFALLQLGQIIFDVQEEANRSQYLMGPLTDEDAGGTFTISYGYDYNWFGWHVYNQKWIKQYNSGPMAGQTVNITENDYNKAAQEMKLLWGYIDFWGNFQPGALRKQLPVVPSEATQQTHELIYGGRLQG